MGAINLGHCAPRGTRRSRGASALLFMEVFQTEHATLATPPRGAVLGSSRKSNGSPFGSFRPIGAQVNASLVPCDKR
jgi:hypothetical protein